MNGDGIVDALRQAFWINKISRLSSDDGVRDFCRKYLELVNYERPRYLFGALSNLKLSDLSLAKQVYGVCQNFYNDKSVSIDDTYIAIARAVNFVMPDDFRPLLIENMTGDRRLMVTNLKAKAIELDNDLMLDYDIAYAIVDLGTIYKPMTYEDADSELYQIWDMATELEIPRKDQDSRQRRNLVDSLSRLIKTL